MLPTVTSRASHSATSVTFTASGKPPRQLLSTAHWPLDSPDHHTMPSEGGDAGGEAEVADSAMNWWALTGCSDLRGRQRKATQADLSHYALRGILSFTRYRHRYMYDPPASEIINIPVAVRPHGAQPRATRGTGASGTFH